MIKDLMKSIFNEDIDLDEEVEEVEEIEEVAAPQPVAPIEEVVAPSPVQAIPAMNVAQPVQPQPTAAPVQPTVQTVQQPRVHSESFADLSIDDVNQPESDVMRRRPYKYDRKKLNKVGQRTQPEEEYNAVLSPIFGNAENNEKDYKKVHDAVDLEKPVDDSEFIQVISPMFGTSEVERIPAYSIPKKNPVRKNKTEKKKADVSVKSVVANKEPEVVKHPFDDKKEAAVVEHPFAEKKEQEVVQDTLFSIKD